MNESDYVIYAFAGIIALSGFGVVYTFVKMLQELMDQQAALHAEVKSMAFNGEIFIANGDSVTLVDDEGQEFKGAISKH